MDGIIPRRRRDANGCRDAAVPSNRRRIAGHAGHCLRLLHVSLKTGMFESCDEAIDCLLQEDRVPSRYACIVHVKDRKKGLRHLVQLLPLQIRIFPQNAEPFPHHRIHHNDKKICRWWAPFDHTAARLERRASVPRGTAHIRSLVPKMADQTTQDWGHAVLLQNQEGPLPFHNAECLIQVDEDPLKGACLMWASCCISFTSITR